MKVALCFSGLPRNIQDTYVSIYENLIKPNNIEDVFMHVWECEDGTNIGNKWESCIYDRSDRAFMLEKYASKGWLEETQESFKNSPNYLSDDLLDKYVVSKNTTRSDKLCQFYSLFQSVKLISEYQKKHGFVYDMIIKLRFDLMFFSPIIVEDLDQRVLHVSDFMTNIGTRSMVNDWFAIGNYDNIQKYAEIWNNITMLLDQGIKFHPEELIAGNLKNYGIEIDSFLNMESHTLYKYFVSQCN